MRREFSFVVLMGLFGCSAASASKKSSDATNRTQVSTDDSWVKASSVAKAEVKALSIDSCEDASRIVHRHLADASNWKFEGVRLVKEGWVSDLLDQPKSVFSLYDRYCLFALLSDPDAPIRKKTKGIAFVFKPLIGQEHISIHHSRYQIAPINVYEALDEE